MSAKIARGAPARTKSKGKSIARGSSRKVAPPVIETLPLPAETVRRVSWWIFFAVLLALLLAAAAAFRLPQMLGSSVGELVGQAGFAVERVEVKGASRMDPLKVQLVAVNQKSTAMPLVDLRGTRERLLRFGWVQDARVYRRWPDTLVVDIVERQPAAIWQHNQQLTLIDRDGIELEPVKLDAMPDLPLVIGPGANRHGSELSRLIDAAPELRPMLAGATWVGGRRWDLRFESGEVLALPEGQESAQRSLVRFAHMDKSTQLLGRGFARFDMRIPGKFIVRVSREPGSTVPDIEAQTPEAPSAPVDVAKTI